MGRTQKRNKNFQNKKHNKHWRIKSEIKLGGTKSDGTPQVQKGHLSDKKRNKN